MGVPLQATYGRPAGTQEDPGGWGGANKARDEWWQGQGNNDRDQANVGQGAYDANTQAQNAHTRGPQAVENQQLANNEASGAGGHQQGAIGMANTLARGTQPSQAAYQLQHGLNQASDQQTAMGRSARGGAAIATAGANAQANQAALQQNAYTQAGILKAQDMSMGRGMLGSQLQQQRDQAGQRLGQANLLGQNNSDRNDKFAIGMGQAAAGLGDVANQQQQQDLQWYQGGMQSVEAQSEADQQRQRWLADEQNRKVAAAIEDD